MPSPRRCEPPIARPTRIPRSSTLLVLRDPYNLFASRLKWFHGRGEPPTAERFEEFRTLWKLHAGEFLGTTHWLPEAVHVRYNDWFRSRAYRDELAGRIGFENTDRGVEKIARWADTSQYANDPQALRRRHGFDKCQDIRLLIHFYSLLSNSIFIELDFTAK